MARVTGGPGLTGGRDGGDRGRAASRHAYAQRPDGYQGESLLDPPGDLARWARQAAATPTANLPARLAVQRVELQFPDWAGQRIVTRAIAEVVPTGRVTEEGPGAAAAAADSSGSAAKCATAGAGAEKPKGAPTATAPAPATAGSGRQPAGLTLEGARDNARKVLDTF